MTTTYSVALCCLVQNLTIPGAALSFVGHSVKGSDSDSDIDNQTPDSMRAYVCQSGQCGRRPLFSQGERRETGCFKSNDRRLLGQLIDMSRQALPHEGLLMCS